MFYLMNTDSTLKNVIRGVPHGSIIGSAIVYAEH